MLKHNAGKIVAKLLHRTCLFWSPETTYRVACTGSYVYVKNNTQAFLERSLSGRLYVFVFTGRILMHWLHIAIMQIGTAF